MSASFSVHVEPLVFPEIGAYASSNVGQSEFTWPTTQKLGRCWVTDNCVADGCVLSNPTTISQWQDYGPEGRGGMVDGTVGRRLGIRQDIASGVHFSVSAGPSRATGRTLSLDGGHAL